MPCLCPHLATYQLLQLHMLVLAYFSNKQLPCFVCRDLIDARKERDEARALASLAFDGPPPPRPGSANGSGSGASGDKSPAVPGSPLAGDDSAQTEL